MGCEKLRDGGGLGVGGVRASMERRWLINAKTTVMRQKKWQEVRMQKEQEEVKKAAEILERRKRERARLAAYIRMQPAKSTGSASRYTRNGKKRSNWNTCLMKDQEIIMRVREKSAVAHNSYYQKEGIPADTLWQGSEEVQQVGAYTSSYLKGFHALDQNFLTGTRYLEDTAYESCSNQETYHHDTDQMSEFSAAKYSIKSEPVRHRNWALDTGTYATLADESRGQPVAKTKRSSANNTHDLLSATESDNSEAPPKNTNHPVISKLEESYAIPNSAALGREESTSELNCDLREEILRARQANEAATARLIAEANAIESRLEDCSLSLKPLDFREVQPGGVTEELNRYTTDTDRLSCDSLGETDSNFSSYSNDVTSGSQATRTNHDGHGEPQHESFKSHEQMTEQPTVAGASVPQPYIDTDWNTVTVGSPDTHHEIDVARVGAEFNGPERAKRDDDQTCLRTLRKRAAAASPDSKPSGEIDWTINMFGSHESHMKTEELDFQATKEAYNHHKAVTAVSKVVSSAISQNTVAPNASPRNPRSLVWDIDWETPTERWLHKRLDCRQSNLQVSPSRTPGRGGEKVATKQNSVQCQQQTEDAASLRDERQRFDGCHRRPPTIPGCGANIFRTPVDMPPLPLHHLNLGFSQPMSRGYIQTQSLHPTSREHNTIQEAPWAPVRRTDSAGDKENYRKVQSGALTEEEEKIFASLERLDWKLAALQTRSLSSGRESFVSQGEFSTKSAPAVMGPPMKNVGLAGLHCAKKPLPYSTAPPRPLTPQSQRPPTSLRRRRQVGLTNKCSGRASHCCPKYPTGVPKNYPGDPDVIPEKWHSSGTIVCHQSARELLGAAAAC